MENNNSNQKSDQISLDFNEEASLKFPHKCGFIKDISQNNNNFFIASIHCLTNIKYLSEYMKDKNCQNPYIKLINSIILESKEINNDLLNYKDYIYARHYKKQDTDPRILINFILSKDFKKDNILPDFLCIKFLKTCDECKNTSECDELDKIDNLNIKFNIPEIIKYNKEKKIDKITIYNCLDYYFENTIKNKKYIYCSNCKDKKNHIIKIQKLPDVLFIFIDYGDNKNCHFENSSYEYEEIIDFQKYDFLEDKRNNKYFLSSLITCKNIGDYFETFYTFAREDKDSKYVIYNGNDVRENLNVKNKIKKDKIDFTNKKESYPFVLVYTNLNEKENNDQEQNLYIN